ncbi:MAG: rod shape-determining protein MreD [Candidatus Omnitrophota bacterium]
MYKISRFKIYSVLAAGLLLHLTILDRIGVLGVKPDLMLIPVIFFGFFLGRGAGIESGFAAGLMKDLFALDLFGINALIFAVTGYAAAFLGTQFSRESRRTQFLLVFLLTAFSMALHFAVVSFFSKRIHLDIVEYLAGSVIPTCVYTGLVSIPIFVKLAGAYGLRKPEYYL